MATHLPLVLVNGEIQRLPGGDSIATVPTEGLGLPDPSALADGCMLVVQGGQWVIRCPGGLPTSCTNTLFTSLGNQFLTVEGGFCLAEAVCSRSLLTANGDIFNTSEGAFCLPE